MSWYRFIRGFLSQTVLFILGMQCAYSQTSEELFRQSLAESANGSCQKALNLINSALGADSSNSSYFFQRATIHYCLGNYDLSIKDCYSAQKLTPDMPEVYLLRGKICLVTQSFGPGILFFGKAINRTKDNNILFDAYLNRGESYLSIKKYNEALVDFNHALSINSSSIEALLSSAEACLFLNRYKQAIETLNSVLVSDANNAQAYELKGRIMLEDNKLEDAAEAYEKYATLLPGDVNTMNTLGNIYLLMKEYDKAYNAVNKAIVIEPLNPNSYKIKGQIQISQGDIEKGCNTLFRSMQLGYFEKYGYDLLDFYISTCEE